MHTSIYLFKLLVVMVLTTLQSCFFSKNSKQNLSKQIPSYTVSLTPKNQTASFEDQIIPIDIFFTSQDENIKNNCMAFRIKKISIEGIGGHLETENGELLKDGHDFVCKDEGYSLFFIPVLDEKSRYCRITLYTLLIDKYGNEAPESTHKVVSYQLYVYCKENKKVTIQEEQAKEDKEKEKEKEQENEEEEEKCEEEEKEEEAAEANFSVTLIPLSVDYFSHKASKWELNITSDFNDNDTVSYKIIAIDLKQGVFKLNGDELKVGDEVLVGNQELVFIPNGFTGKFLPIIVIKNSKSQTTTVLLGENDYQFYDAGFFANIFCEEKIVLTLGANHLPNKEEWILEDYIFEGGVSGKLYDKSTNNEIIKPLKIQAGTTYIDCSLDVENLCKTPIVTCYIVHPDGRKEAIRVDISSIVLSILASKIDAYKKLLSNLVYSKTDPDVREQIIEETKQVILKMDYVIGQEKERIKISSYVLLNQYPVLPL